jgi:hypothetical protein
MTAFNEWLDLQPIDPALAGVAREAVASWGGGWCPLDEEAAKVAVKRGWSRANARRAGERVDALYREYRAWAAAEAAADAARRGDFLAWERTQPSTAAGMAVEFWSATGEGQPEDWAEEAAASQGGDLEGHAARRALAVLATYRASGGTMVPMTMAAHVRADREEKARRLRASIPQARRFAELLFAFGRASNDVRPNERQLVTPDGRVWAVRYSRASNAGWANSVGVIQYIEEDIRWVYGPDLMKVMPADVEGGAR